LQKTPLLFASHENLHNCFRFNNIPEPAKYYLRTVNVQLVPIIWGAPPVVWKAGTVSGAPGINKLEISTHCLKIFGLGGELPPEKNSNCSGKMEHFQKNRKLMSGKAQPVDVKAGTASN
jgi:hypothetical protein